jgi:hypothetical protein
LRRRGQPTRERFRMPATAPPTNYRTDNNNSNSNNTNSIPSPTPTSTPASSKPSSSTPASSKPSSSTPSNDQENSHGESLYECNICLDTASLPVVTLCGHLYCWPCLHQVSAQTCRISIDHGQ